MSARMRVFTEDECDELARRYRAGEKLDALVASTGRSATAVRNALFSRGVKMRRVGDRQRKDSPSR